MTFANAKVGLSIVTNSLLIASLLPFANVEAPDSIDALQDLATQVVSHEVQVLANAVDPGTSTDPDIVAVTSVPGIVTEFPFDTSGEITLSSEHASDVDPLSIALPFAKEGSEAVIHSEGAIGFENGNSTSTLATTRVDGALQIVTVIEDSQAPSRFAYEYNVPPGGYLQMASTGEVYVVGPDGIVVAAVQPAWAYDAVGEPVPTYFETDGTTLVQVVEHSNTFEYPVVADPTTLFFWWGQAIKFTRSETKTIADLAGRSKVAAAFCGLIASAPGAVVCGIVSWLVIDNFARLFATAYAQGRCGQINMPYVGIVIGGPITWSAHSVRC